MTEVILAGSKHAVTNGTVSTKHIIDSQTGQEHLTRKWDELGVTAFDYKT